MTRVLIVDDHADNRALFRALLTGHGFLVDEARHGAEALERAQAAAPDAVVADLLMPVMDGYTMLRQWTRDERLRAIPFIVCTATYTEPRDERLALALGASAFILKPIEPDDFVTRLRDVLAQDPAARVQRLPEGETEVLLREYNEVLIHKLEKRALELEQANRQLRARESALALRDRAIQAVSQGILISDPNQPDHPVIFASAGFERMTGYSADEVLGRNCRFLQGKDTDPAAVATLRDAIAGGRAANVELLNYRKDGSAFWNAVSVNPVHDESGALAYFVGIQSDVTQRRSLEQQLRQAQRMEAVGQLAGGIAHDFNNLLTIITGYSTLVLAAPDLSAEIRDWLTEIKDAGARASSLTRQLLGFSRRAIVQPEVLDLNVVIDRTSRLLRRLIGADISFNTALAPELAFITIDPGQLDQVLMNLAVNARDAMAAGGTLSIETANVVLDADHCASHLDCAPGPHVMLAITDSGSGMATEVLDRIFEPFFTTKDVGKGTGLGLSVVFGVVQQAGGGIDVRSEVGAGTTFKIYFPAVPVPVSRSSDPSLLPVVGGTETILLVEDEGGVRAFAAASLRSQGYRVLTAADGMDAMGVVRAHEGPIELVVTDVVMPGTSGPDLVDRLRALRPNIGVLYMSGYTDDSVVRHGLLASDVALIQKPFSPRDLAVRVRRVLDDRA